MEKQTHLPLIPFDAESHTKISVFVDPEEQQEVLKKIKEEHKPIRLKEIRKFAKKMQKEKEKLIKQNHEKLRKKIMQQNESFDPSKYMTKFQKDLAEKEKLRQLENESQEREKLELLKKRKKFSQIVTVTHKPKISQKKRKELELRMLLKHNTGNIFT